MKILYTNPFAFLGNWTNRMKVMVELLRESGHDVVFYKEGLTYVNNENQFKTGLIQLCETFNPDIIIAHGSELATLLIDYSDRLIIDLGSFYSSEYLIQKQNLNYANIHNYNAGQLESLLDDDYPNRKQVLSAAKAVLTFEGWEYELAKKIYPEANIIAHSPLYIPAQGQVPNFTSRENKAIAIASKWYRKSKNGKFMSHYNKFIQYEIKADDKYLIKTYGHGGSETRFLLHDDLLKLMGTVKTVVFPMLSGGNCTQIEALKMGCNVIVQNRHPFRIYNNPELEIDMSTDMWSRTYNLIRKSYDNYYPPIKAIPTAEVQIERLIGFFNK